MEIKDLTRKSKKVNFKLFQHYKSLYQALKAVPDQKHILFIVGCQRSGTTLMTRIFERDIRTRVFGEFSPISDQDPNQIRLNPLDQVEERLDREKAEFIVAKPLVESQHISSILDHFEHAKAIWMFRHYKDVALSNLKNFGNDNGIRDLRPIVEDKPDNWRNENVSAEIREQVQRVFHENMPALDAAAWFWWVRNKIFLEQNLDQDPRIGLVKYEDLVLEPQKVMEKVYRFAGNSYPGDKILSEVFSGSVGKAWSEQLSEEVTRHCDMVWHELNQKYEKQVLSI
jgi:hypothetical protein